MSQIVPLILAGGSGTRLWPVSRSAFPKPFHGVVARETMLESTVRRLRGIADHPPIFVASEEHRFMLADQARRVGLEHPRMVLEPVARGTAPAIALGALAALDTCDDPIVFALPSDHSIRDPAALREVVERALDAVSDSIVTFGVPPTRPDTGYGYVRATRSDDANGGRTLRVARFVEKPDVDLARDLVAEGGHYWNSGMFLFRADVYLEELARHRPDIYEPVLAAHAGGVWEESTFLPGTAFADCPTDSIDYAVMERTDRARIVVADVGWSDVGSWLAVWEASRKDDADNAFSGDVLDRGSTRCLVRSDHRLVATIGLEDVAVVEGRDAVLVARMDRVHEVKDLVGALASAGRSESQAHAKCFRPWGSYEILEKGPGFQVKRICVTPGAILSLQSHRHRAEHWVAVCGEGEVTLNDDTFTIRAGESAFIPLGARHRLANPGSGAFELIEVQIGSYLGEDDIVRYEDRYGRVGEQVVPA